MKNTITILVGLLMAAVAMASDSSFYYKTSDGTSLYVRTSGKGKPCLFVHGGPGSTSYYFEQVPASTLIEEKLRMIYFDQRGSGRSSSPSNGDYSLKRMLKDMEEIRSALGIKKWVVMGHSFGGIFITNYAKQYPTSVTALLMIHGTLDMHASMENHISFGLKELQIANPAAYRDTTKPLIERVGMIHNQLTEKDIWYKLMYRNAYEKKWNDSVTFSIGKFNRDFASKVWELSEYMKDFTPLTRNIRCPVLVMTGKRDYAIGPDHYLRFHFPNQTTVKYIGGHAPFQEEPQWFSEKILAFAERL